LEVTARLAVTKALPAENDQVIKENLW